MVLMKNAICRNPRCGETLNVWSGARLCPACRYLARWAFGAGAFAAGVVAGLVKLFG